MKVLITGATGFLGTSLCTYLESQGHEIVRLNSRNCDLTNQESLLRFRSDSYDQIYHLAAWTQAGDFCLHHAGEQWLINQQMNTNVLTWWQKYQSQAKLIAIGTSCAYGEGEELVESNYLQGNPIDSLFTYAMSKRMMYVGLLALRKQFGLNYLHVVPSTLYGSNYHTDGRQMHFIFDLIRKIIRAKVHGDTVVLWGDGQQQRELIYVDDFVFYLTHLAKVKENETYNIGAGEEFSIRFFAEKICEYIDYDSAKIEYDTSRYVGARSKCLNVEKLMSVGIDYEPTTLEAGLQKTIDWFWENRDKLISSTS